MTQALSAPARRKAGRHEGPDGVRNGTYTPATPSSSWEQAPSDWPPSPPPASSIRNLTITTGLVDTTSTPLLLDLLAEGRLGTEGMITHRFDLDDMLGAYGTFSRAAETGALKVALFRR